MSKKCMPSWADLWYASVLHSPFLVTCCLITVVIGILWEIALMRLGLGTLSERAAATYASWVMGSKRLPLQTSAEKSLRVGCLSNAQ